MAKKLGKLGLNITFDLLFHLPIRYEDRTHLTPFTQLKHGQDALILGTIESCNIQFGRRRSLSVTINDGGSRMVMRLFYFNAYQQKALKQGHWLSCYGQARYGAQGLEMTHPEYRIFQSKPQSVTNDTLTPVYPLTEGITQTRIRRLIVDVLDTQLDSVQELLPKTIRKQFQLLPLTLALHTLHTPTCDDDLSALTEFRHPAQLRLALEELLAHHLALRTVKMQRSTVKAPNIKTTGSSWPALKNKLPFQLTNAQLRAIDEIETDFNASSPALRMVQGDVGCGKTIVAAAAILHVVDSGFQAVIMAPTELLAEQHRQNFSQWCQALSIPVTWLASRLPSAEKKNACEAIKDGQAQIIIGTHALFQQGVEFKNLGLIVVDEQHRFGVDQRLALKNKGQKNGRTPHQIIMSATPIPRSLSMVYYANMDVSNIDELPPERIPVETVVLANTRRDEIQARIRVACSQGRQAYWVCPLIEKSDVLQAEAATLTAQKLSTELPEIKIALIHGKLKTEQKDAIMASFRAGNIDLLVATTVIEVGVDVPRASVMIIENAERLGLAQLHQLRGRVGRGEQQSVCVLMYQAPLGQNSRRRLDILRQTNDGFEIARHDLQFRGPGELMGTRQTGEQGLKIANIVRDQALLPIVQQTADVLLQNHSSHIPKIIDRWVRKKAQYVKV